MTESTVDPARALAQAVHTETANGRRIESQTATHATLAKGKNVNHIVHGVITVLTGGLWAVVWIPTWLINKRKVLQMSVDEYGNVSRNEV
jgi:hypothetical protein